MDRDQAQAEREGVRARAGERVWIRLNRVKADQREAFEHLVTQVLRPAVEQLAPEAAQRVRLLIPREADDDGNYIYVFLMDPVVDGVDYEMRPALRQFYGEEQGDAYLAQLNATVAGPQSGYDLTQAP